MRSRSQLVQSIPLREQTFNPIAVFCHSAAPFTHVGIIFSICFVGYDEQHNYTYQFLELFLMRSSLFLMSNMLSGSVVIESVVSVDCEITEGCKK